MSTRWRYYNTKRGGNGFRGRGRGNGRGRGKSLAAVSLPRDDIFHNGTLNNAAFYRDKAMDPTQFRDETVLSISFGQNMLGAAFYEQSSQILKIMNDISEDHEFEFVKRLIEEVQPTMLLSNKSQDLGFIKFLGSQCKTEVVQKDLDTTEDQTTCSVPAWNASLAYSGDETTIGEEIEDDEESADNQIDAKLYKLPNAFFKMPRALERLKLMVSAEDASLSDEDKITIVKMRFDMESVNMLRSLGALLHFLDETRLGVESEPLSVAPRIKSIRTLKLQHLVDIDFNTIQALDILPKEAEKKKAAGKRKSLYSLVDMCRSTNGKKVLQKWFRNPTTDRNELFSRQKCVHFFKQDWNAEVTAKLSSLVAKIRPLNNVFLRFQSGTAHLIHWEGFVATVNALVEMANIIKQTTIASELLVESGLLTEVSEVAVITSSIINFAESKIQGRVTIMPGIDANLDNLKNTYENMPLMLTSVAKRESDRLGLVNCNCLYVPLVGFILSLPADFPVDAHPDMELVYATSDELRVKNGITNKLEEEFGDILMKIIDSQTAIILAVKTRLMKRKRSINKLLNLAARIDALVSLGLVAAENGWNCPALVDEPIIEATEVFHPISALTVKKNFVPNGVSSGRDGVKVSIITGPNACGKSIYMKSIGILAFLSHIGSFVPARHAKVGVVDRIVTRMFTVDSVLDGMSTFAEDVEQVALALRKATANSLVIIDEFGKGTMTEVGLSLLAACMSHWMKKGFAKCPHLFLSSHFHALPKYIPLDTNIATFLTFTVLREEGGNIKYMFQLTPGLVDCSFAMTVAKEEGIPTPVLGRACLIYKALKSGTPLKEIRAEVNNVDEELLISDMDKILDDEYGFIDAIESFTKRQGVVTPDVRPVDAPPQQSEESSEPKDTRRKRRPSTVLSLNSFASMDQQSLLDALLPVRKPKLKAVVEETSLVSTSSRSPDPFTSDGEEEPSHTSTNLIPLMQRLSSEEEEKSASSRNTTAILEATPNKRTPHAKEGLKRARTSSITEQSATHESNFHQSNIEALKEPAFETFFVEPRHPALKTVPSDEESQFKTPSNEIRSRNSTLTSKSRSFVLRTPVLSARKPNPFHVESSSSRSSKQSIRTGSTDSLFGRSPDSGRASSRREIRAEEHISPWGSISPEKETSPIQESNNNTEKFLSRMSSISKKPQFVAPQDFVFQTPENRMIPKNRSQPSKTATSSRVSISPSSVILGELGRGNEEMTPVPRGDCPIDADFEFNPTEDDPVYGKRGPTNNLNFDFIKSDEEDEEFLHSFFGSDRSSKT